MTKTLKALALGLAAFSLLGVSACDTGPAPEDAARCAQLQGEVDATAMGVDTGGIGDAFMRGVEMDELDC